MLCCITVRSLMIFPFEFIMNYMVCKFLKMDCFLRYRAKLTSTCIMVMTVTDPNLAKLN